jgi:transposase
VADDRTADGLAGYFDGLSIDDRLAIEAIAMDMWDPYRRAVRDYVPDGDLKIVFDRFHVMRHVTEAMDQVRRRENRVLRQRGDKRLTGTKFLWLKTRVGATDFTAVSRRQFRALRKSTLNSARAWASSQTGCDHDAAYSALLDEDPGPVSPLRARDVLRKGFGRQD